MRLHGWGRRAVHCLGSYEYVLPTALSRAALGRVAAPIRFNVTGRIQKTVRNWLADSYRPGRLDKCLEHEED